MNLETYKNTINKLKEFNKIINDILPITINKEKIEKKDLDDFLEVLEDKKYTVSICSQVKAGKSTFLNAWLFKHLEILPVAATPETAKLTIINYGDKKAKIEFYTQEDLNLLLEDKTFKEYFNQEQERLGSIDYSYLNKTIEIELNQLPDYVSRYGKYTILVKQVFIDYPLEILKNITLVDTPGLNDPNIIRSQITKDWIYKSTATIYLTYAGKALDKEDKEFIVEYLADFMDKVILAVTKIDTLDNIESFNNVKEYIKTILRQSLGNSADILLQNGIHLISPMYYLYQNMYQKLENEEIEVDEEKIDDIIFQIEERNSEVEQIVKNNSKEYMENFIDFLENKVFSNVYIFDIYYQKINLIINSYIKKYSKELKILKLEYDLINQDKEFLLNEIEKTKLLQQELKIFKNHRLKELHTNIKLYIEDEIFSFIESIWNRFVTLKINCDKSWFDENKKETIILNVQAPIINRIDNFIKELNSLNDIIKNIFQKYEQEITKEYKDIIVSSNISDIAIDFISKYEIDINFNSIKDEIKNKIKLSLDERLFEDSKINIKKRKIIFFTKEVLDEEASCKKLQENINKKIYELKFSFYKDNSSIKKFINQITTNFLKNIDKEINNSIKTYNNKLIKYQEDERLNIDTSKLEQKISLKERLIKKGKTIKVEFDFLLKTLK